MAKTVIKLERRKTPDIRNKYRFFYTEKYFNKWMSKYGAEGLNYQQIQYIMTRFWSEGNVACSPITNANKGLAGLVIDGLIDMGSNDLIFTPWSHAQRFNIYNFSTHARLINTRGVKFITNKDLEVDKEVVIIWAQKNHKSVFSSIEAKLNEIIDLEMTKRTALKSQKQPWLFTFDPEDRENAKIMQEQLDNDNPYVFVPLNKPNMAKGFTSGAPYIVDKIEQQIQKCDSDILTILGVNNVGIGEKKEHLIVDEVNANNQDIKENDNAFESEIQKGFDRVNKVFNKNIKLIDMNEQFEGEEKEDDEDVDEE